MTYYGDFPTSHTAVCIPFDSFAASTGAPAATTNFANTDIQIYKDGGTTQRSSASGIVVTTSFDTNTGLQMITIDLSDNTDAGFYVAGHEYQVAVADITVDGQTLRFWAGCFSIERANGALARIKAGTIKVDVDTIKTNPVVNGGTVTFTSNSTVASTTNITAGTITTVSGNVTGSVGSVTGSVGSVTGNVGGNVVGSVGSVTGNVGGNVTGSVGSVVGAVGSVTGNVGGNVVGTVASVVGAVGSVTGNVGGNVTGSVGSVTGNVGGNVVGSVASVTGNIGGNLLGTLTAAERNAISDALIARNIAGGSSAGRTIKTALALLRNKQEIVAGVMTVYDTDDTTALYEANVTTTAGNPISAWDPTS